MERREKDRTIMRQIEGREIEGERERERKEMFYLTML